MPAFTFIIEPCQRSADGWTPCHEVRAECFRVSRDYPPDGPPEVMGHSPTRQAAWDFIARKIGKLPL